MKFTIRAKTLQWRHYRTADIFNKQWPNWALVPNKAHKVLKVLKILSTFRLKHWYIHPWWLRHSSMNTRFWVESSHKNETLRSCVACVEPD